MGNGKWPEAARREMEAELEKAIREAAKDHPIASQFKKIVFTSRSKGRGRKRKHPKTVILLSYGKKCIEVASDVPVKNLDIIAQEIVGEIVAKENGEDSWEIFLETFNNVEPVTNI